MNAARVRSLGLAAYGWAALGFLALPLLAIVPLSFSSVRFFIFPPPRWSTQWYVNFLTSPEWKGALATSLAIGVSSMLAATVLGTLGALGLARTKFRGKSLLYVAILSPLMNPTIIIAIALYIWFVPLRLIGSPVAIVLGHVTIGIPYVVLVVGAALERFDPSLERAALSLGAHPFLAVWFVVLPVIRPAILSAAFLSFLASFDELLIALFVSGPTVVTLPIQMWRGIRFESDPTIAAASTILLVISILAAVMVRAGRPTSSAIAPQR
jgi:ABC-type spermidine/putrescine transport system permease subunit II